MKKLILSLAAGVLLLPALSFASFWRADDNVSITALQPVQENAYLAGSSVTVSGTVGGDLFAAGKAVSISGNVSHDIMAAGSLLNLTGAKAEDVRVAGSSVNIGGIFSGELLAAGAQIMVSAETQIAKNVYLTGSALNFSGKGAGDVSLSGERVEFNGSAGKNLTVKTAEALVIGPDAVIKGDLNYSAPMEAVIDPGAQISGKINFSEIQTGKGRNGLRAAVGGFLTMIFLIKLLAILLAAYLLWYLRKKDSAEVVQQAASKFGTSLLRGFVFLVVVPVAVIILFFTVIGLPIGIFSIFMYAALLMLACPFAVLLASSLLMKRKLELQWYHILLGAVVLTILKVVPIVGWLAVFVVYLAALGSLLTVLRTKFKR